MEINRKSKWRKTKSSTKTCGTIAFQRSIVLRKTLNFIEYSGWCHEKKSNIYLVRTILSSSILLKIQSNKSLDWPFFAWICD
jgi:hypothetical protein